MDKKTNYDGKKIRKTQRNFLKEKQLKPDWIPVRGGKGWG